MPWNATVRTRATKMLILHAHATLGEQLARGYPQAMGFALPRARRYIMLPPTGGDRSQGRAMQRSTKRFLTTHTGSLPRPEALIRAMFAKEEGVPVDDAALKARIRDAVAAIVKKQVEAGIDLVNDGEMSKPSYATYIKDRLNGFGGTSQPLVYQDLVAFPDLARRVFGDPGRSRRKTPGCNAPVSVRDRTAAATDVENLKAALKPVAVEGAFISAASPGVISLFFHNGHYPSHEAYLFAIAEAMRAEYESITNAGFVLQLDCPDLAMGRHIQYAHLGIEDFKKQARLHIEALNHAIANIPAEQVRLHLCWGNYEGPHHCDVPLRDIIEVVFQAKASGLSFEAANPRHAHEWTVFEEVKLPAGKVLIPGVIESKTNFIEHPELIAQRIGRYAKLVGRENVIAGSDCGYGTWVGQAAVDPAVVWAKLASMAEGARLATRQFWG
jgi:5-methyltetrahydropteroyltriglutamate--homocysteine methyltransferase